MYQHYILFASVIFASIGVIFSNDCVMANFEVQPDFKLTKYLGKWYEIEWIPETYIDPEDNFKDFEWRQSMHNNSYVEIISLGRARTSDEECIEGHDGLTLTDEPAKFLYNRRYNSTARFETPYWVILTDYEHYCFAFGCRELSEHGVCTGPDAWIWSRTTTLADEYMAIIDQKIPELCLTKDQFVVTEQNNECPYEDLSGSNNSNTVHFSEALLLGILLCIYNLSI